jgi:hypothetical protein
MNHDSLVAAVGGKILAVVNSRFLKGWKWVLVQSSCEKLPKISEMSCEKLPKIPEIPDEAIAKEIPEEIPPAIEQLERWEEPNVELEGGIKHCRRGNWTRVKNTRGKKLVS